MNHDLYAGLARALFEESDEALFLIDPETGQVLDANAAAQRLCGLSLRAILDSPVHDFFRGEGGERLIDFPLTARKVDFPNPNPAAGPPSNTEPPFRANVTLPALTVPPRP